MAVIEVSAGNGFLIGQSVSSNFKIVSVSSTLELTHSDEENPKARAVNDTLTVSHAARTTYGSRTVSVASFLTFYQGTHPRSLVASASNYFALGHLALHPFFEEIGSDLVLGQDVSGERANAPKGILELTQEALGQLVRTRQVSHTLSLQSHVNHYLFKRDYYVLPTPLPPAPDASVQFIYDGITIALPRPEIGNTLTLNFTRVNRRTRGGDLVIYSDEQWPKTKTLNLTFAWLKPEQKTALLKMMQDTVGRELVYEDHYGFVWDGFIMTPAAKVTQESLNNKQVSIDFQGVRR